MVKVGSETKHHSVKITSNFHPSLIKKPEPETRNQNQKPETRNQNQKPEPEQEGDWNIQSTRENVLMSGLQDVSH